MAKAVRIGTSSVLPILHEDLGMEARKMKKAHGLTEKRKEKWLTRYKKLKRRFTGGKHRSIMFTDEKLQNWLNKTCSNPDCLSHFCV